MGERLTKWLEATVIWQYRRSLSLHVILSGWKNMKDVFLEILLIFGQNVKWPEGVSSLFVLLNIL